MLSDAIKPTMTTDEAHSSVVDSLNACFLRTLTDIPVPALYLLTIVFAGGAHNWFSRTFVLITIIEAYRSSLLIYDLRISCLFSDPRPDSYLSIPFISGGTTIHIDTSIGNNLQYCIQPSQTVNELVSLHSRCKHVSRMTVEWK
jgi:hypothetical protein